VGEPLLIQNIAWHTVRSAETMAAIARIWRIPVASLERANPGVTDATLAAGVRLLIPAT
jgi:hypothetical protein